MAYTPHIWQCGETITQTNMNRMEEGIQEALECCDSKYIVTITSQYDEQADESRWVADHSAEEIMEAYNQGKTVIAQRAVEGAMLIYQSSAIGTASNYNYASFSNVDVSDNNNIYAETIKIDDFQGYDRVVVNSYYHQIISNT